MNIDAFFIIIHSGVTAIPRKPKVKVPWALKNIEVSSLVFLVSGALYKASYKPSFESDVTN